jgi:hypothetical protein
MLPLEANNRDEWSPHFTPVKRRARKAYGWFVGLHVEVTHGKCPVIFHYRLYAGFARGAGARGAVDLYTFRLGLSQRRETFMQSSL